MKIGKLFSKESTGNALTSIGAFRLHVSHSSLIHTSLLMLILVIAATIRLLPLQWGVQLSEFDPYMHYRLTQHMVENGIFSYNTWVDTMSWYPNGLQVSDAIFPGVAATAAILYQIASALNLAPAPILSSSTYHPLTADPLFNFVVFFPVMMATITVLVMYFVGRDIGGKSVGLFSAFFLALSSSYISRTGLGFFDDESVGILGILLFIFFFLRSIDSKRTVKTSFAYAVGAGLSLAYIFASWGAARYPLGVTLIFVLAMILVKRYSPKLLISYATTFGISIALAVAIPKLGVNFLMEPTVLAVIGMFLVLCMVEVSRRIPNNRNKLLFVVGFLAVLVVGFVTLSALGLVGGLEAKLIAVLFPGERVGTGAVQQLVQSVQEHQASTWGSFYYDVGIGLLFIPVGLYFAVQNPTNRNIFMVIFGLTSIYFAGSFVRLSLLMAPAVCILWALALVQMVKPFVTILRENPTPKRKMRFKPRVGKEFSAIFIILMFVLLTVTFIAPSGELTTNDITYSRVINRANSPTTVVSSGLSFRTEISDWLNTLNYMRANLPPGTVVMSWWDYGYWITAIGNKTTLADNGTENATQIGLIGKTFMSNETEAAQFMKDYDVDYVLVFTTFRTTDGTTITDGGYGDEGKWRWMARIGELDDALYGNYTLGQDWTDTDADGSVGDGELITNELGTSTLLYKLMHYGSDIAIFGSSTIELEHYQQAYFSQESNAVQWYQVSSSEAFGAMVCLYKVNYD
ncbi:MAG: STT3 domain-containing protein [Candidatus Bathyarchaeia archaeon]